MRYVCVRACAIRYDSELAYDGEYDEPSVYYFRDNAVMGSDSEDDDDDDVLEMRTASSRSRSNSVSSMQNCALATPLSPNGAAASSRPRPPMVRRHSTDREHVTIAPIAPTLLKSTGVGNELATLQEGKALESPKDVDLVYVPTGNHYSLPGTPNMSNGSGDVYHHRESYFSVGTAPTYPRSPLPRSPAPGSSPQAQSATLPPEHQPPHTLMRRTGSGTFFPAQTMVDSPMHIDDAPLEDAYDYFGGPDLGEDFSSPRAHHHRRRPRREIRDDDAHVGVTRYAEGGAASVTTGRSSGWRVSPSPSPADSPRTPDTDMPVVVVNEVNGAVEERQERSRESSPSRSPVVYRIQEHEGAASSCPPVPSTAPVPVPAPRANPAHAHLVSSSSSTPNSIAPSSTPSSGICTDPALLSPSDAVPVRGRTPHAPSVSGSTTTGSSSYHSSDSRSGSSSRGRSSTRTSSFSDRGRSGSQSLSESRSRSRSRGTGTSSPIGSISPTGSAIGIVNGGAYVGGGRYRERERGDVREGRRRGGGSEEERGRERTGRRLGDSLSPPSIVSSPSRGSSDEGGPYQPYSPVLTEAILERERERLQPGRERAPSPPSSVSGSSTETASVSTVGPSNAQHQHQHQHQHQVQQSPVLPSSPSEGTERPKLSIHAPVAKPPVVPSPIPEMEEEEERRSRHPTPANSPVATFRISVPPAQTAQPVSSPVFASQNHQGAAVSRTSTKSSGDSTSTSTTATGDSPVLDSPTSPVSPSSASRHPSRAQRVSFDGMQEQAGTLVNRAAEIVQSARGFLGSIWSSNAASA